MPSLIIEQPGKRSGGGVEGRVLIGRLPTNGIVVNDSSVSRLHAWIDADPDGRYFVADSGSLTGTYVNGRTIEKRRFLADGDVIRIGEAQIVFSLEESLPEEVEPLDLGGRPPGQNVEEAGILFDCPCGAPMWFKATTIGQGHTCRHCGRTILVPDRSGVVAQEIAPPLAVTEPGVPPTSASAGVAMQVAPGSPRHAAVHDEHGLGEAGVVATAEAEAEAPAEEQLFEVREDAYARRDEQLGEPSNGDSFAMAHGISEEVLTPAISEEPSAELEAEPPPPTPEPVPLDFTRAEPKAATEAVAEAVPHPPPGVAEVAPPSQRQPATQQRNPGRGWDIVLLLLDLIGAALSAVAYGVPSLIGAIGTIIYLLGFRERGRRGVAVLALLVSIAGAAAGVYASFLWWKGWPPIGPLAHWRNAAGAKS
jgi:predicted component of type VI protein secretion system